MMRTVPKMILPVLAVALLAACGDDGGSASDQPTVVVTTSLLGDVVGELVGDDAEVTVLMPAGADPHDFALSAKQAVELREADVIVQNGAGFEAGLTDALAAAEADGVPVLSATDAVELLPVEDHAVEHADEEHSVDDEHDHEVDPHFFTDPLRMRAAAAGLADGLAEVLPALASDAGQARVEDYLAALDQLDADVEAELAAIPQTDRLLVTNHDVLAYFADRYAFDVLGVVIPGGTTLGQADAATLDHLAEVIEEAGVPAVFAESSSPARLAEALAAEGEDVEVVELYTEALGPEGSGADTYLGMVRTNAERIAAALGAG